MKIPKRLTLEKLYLFIHKIADAAGVKLEKIILNPDCPFGGLAHLYDNAVEYRINPDKKHYNPKHCLYLIIHEIAHLYNWQYYREGGHKGLFPIIRSIYNKLGWSMGIDNWLESSYCEFMTKNNK